MDFFPAKYDDESRTRRQRRNVILQSAHELVAREGLSSVTMQMIADAAHVERRTLYNYYPHKEALAMDIQVLLLNDFYLVPNIDVSDDVSASEAVRSYLYQIVQQFYDKTDSLNFFTQFDLYFRDYDDKDYEQALIRIVNDMPLARFIRAGAVSGEFNLHGATVDDCSKMLLNSLVGFAQRVLFRPQVYQREQSVGRGHIHMLIDMLMAGLLNHSL